MKTVDLNFFPGWTRKSLAFTIDDGNIRLDTKFLGYVKPAGIKGSFNLPTPLSYEKYQMSPADYRKFYEGYEITNHCRFHVYALTPKTRREIVDEPFQKETSDHAYGYRTDEKDLYRIYTYNWTYLAATTEKYMECVKDAQDELESVFGKGKIRTYVWPCGEQENDEVIQAVKDFGFQSMRKTGLVEDSTGFAMPADRMAWSYNANNTCLCAVAEKYENYPDDGNLKFFCFGVHSHDFENANNWDELERFCDRFGNRPNDYWYASVGDIFDYEDAVKSVVVTDTEVKNPSNVDLSIKVDGKPVILPKKGSIKL